MKSILKCSVFISLIMVFVISGAVHALETLEGETVTIISSYPDPEHSEMERKAVEERLERLKEDYGIEVRYKAEHIQQKDDIIEMIRDGDMTHSLIRFISAPFSRDPSLKELLLYPLNDHLPRDYVDELPDYFRPIIEGTAYEGQYYFLPSFMNVEFLDRLWRPFSHCQVILWNREFFSEHNLPTPHELMKEGEWTLENMIDIARSATQDTSDDGEIDKWGLDTLGMGMYNPSLFFYYAAQDIPFLERTNLEYEYNFMASESIKVLEKVQSIYTEGMIAESFAGKFIDGKTAMALASWNNYEHNFLNQTSENLDIGLAYIPTGDGQSPAMYTEFTDVTMVPITAENPEALLKVYDYLYPPDEMEDEFYQWVSDLEVDEYSRELILELTGSWEILDPLNFDLFGRVDGEILLQFFEGEIIPEMLAGVLEEEALDLVDELEY